MEEVVVGEQRVGFAFLTQMVAVHIHEGVACSGQSSQDTVMDTAGLRLVGV